MEEDCDSCNTTSKTNIITPEKIEERTETNPENSEFLVKCTGCFHKDVCYAYLSILGKQEEFKCMKWVALPFAPEALATTCKKYTPAKKVVKLGDEPTV